MLIAICIFLRKKPFFHMLVEYFIVELQEFFIYSEYKFPFGYMICYGLSILWVIFSLETKLYNLLLSSNLGKFQSQFLQFSAYLFIFSHSDTLIIYFTSFSDLPRFFKVLFIFLHYFVILFSNIIIFIGLSLSWLVLLPTQICS